MYIEGINQAEGGHLMLDPKKRSEGNWSVCEV
jgi:hypothetical protein